MIKKFPFNLMFLVTIFVFSFIFFEMLFWFMHITIPKAIDYDIQGIITFSLFLAIYGLIQFRNEDFKNLVLRVTLKEVRKFLISFFINLIVVFFVVLIMSLIFKDDLVEHVRIIVGVATGATIHSFLTNSKKTVKKM